MKFLYACYGKAGLDCLYQLLNQKECKADDLLVLTYADPMNSMLLEHLQALKISFMAESLKDPKVTERVREFSPDFLFSVHYRDIISNEILETVKKAAVNLHPSLLPDYKGCFSSPWALINGEKETGITFHIMEKEVDAGRIVLQERTEISQEDTAFSLFHRLIALGTGCFPRVFELIVREKCIGVPQVGSAGRTYRRGVPFGGRIHLEWGRARIHRFIRAMYFPPHRGAVLDIDGEAVEFHEPDDFDVYCENKEIIISE